MQNTNHIETKTNTASRQWLVAYVQSCLEKKTAQRLAAMGIECYLPVQSEIRQWSDRRKRVDRLVIPMMIFVHVTPQERPLPLSLQAVSRYMVLRGESTPAVIPDEQMDRFRFMLDYSPEAVEMCSAPLAPGDAVKVIKGPLAGLEGELITVNGKSKVAVRLDMLGCAHVDVPIGFVEKRGGGRNRRTKEQKDKRDTEDKRNTKDERDTEGKKDTEEEATRRKGCTMILLSPYSLFSIPLSEFLPYIKAGTLLGPLHGFHFPVSVQVGTEVPVPHYTRTGIFL